MASYRKRGRSWRAELYRDGKRESGTFSTKVEAVAWAMQRETELAGVQLPDHSLDDALGRYAREVSPTKKGAKWELSRIGLMRRDSLASVRLPSLRASHLADWKHRRLQAVSGASVRREMNLLQSVLKVARKEWNWIATDPLADVGKPKSPPSRKRRISDDEIDRMTRALGHYEGSPATVSARIAVAFLFAIETAMRAGEIAGIRWRDVGPLSVRLPKTKNGDERFVPLSKRARELLSSLPNGKPEDRAFGLAPSQHDALFRKARKACEIADLHFHDSRAEGIWRLSKKLDVLELARVIGHRDLKSLLLYYQTSADELAAKLG